MPPGDSVPISIRQNGSNKRREGWNQGFHERSVLFPFPDPPRYTRIQQLKLKEEAIHEVLARMRDLRVSKQRRSPDVQKTMEERRQECERSVCSLVPNSFFHRKKWEVDHQRWLFLGYGGSLQKLEPASGKNEPYPNRTRQIESSTNKKERIS